MSEADRDSLAELSAAIELFNAGKYLAAHEVLEELWEATQGPEEGFYQGLLQAAIALHHLEQGNLEGAARLYRGHRRCLGVYLPRHRGLDLAGFLEAMQRALGPALAAGQPAAAPAERPQLRSA